MPLHVDLVSPERILWSGEADMVIARTVGGGDIAFLPGHSPFVGALEIAPVTIHPSNGAPDEVAAVHGGFVEVSGNNVTILSDLAELASQIDVDRAQRQMADAERRVEQGDNAEAEAEVRRSHVRLLAAGGYSHP